MYINIWPQLYQTLVRDLANMGFFNNILKLSKYRKTDVSFKPKPFLNLNFKYCQFYPPKNAFRNLYAHGTFWETGPCFCTNSFVERGLQYLIFLLCSGIFAPSHHAPASIKEQKDWQMHSHILLSRMSGELQQPSTYLCREKHSPLINEQNGLR